MTMVGDAYAAPLVEELQRGDYDLSSLYAIGTGGAATNPKYQRALLESLPAASPSSTGTAPRRPATWDSVTASATTETDTFSSAGGRAGPLRGLHAVSGAR